MADMNFIARVAGVASGTAAKTLIQLLAPTNQRVKIKEVGIGLHGTSNVAEPITVDLLRQTTAGTASALALAKEDDTRPEAIQTTAQQTVTAEPTAGDIIRTWTIHPQTSQVYQLPIEDEITLGGGKRLGLRVTAAATVNVDAYIRGEE